MDERDLLKQEQVKKRGKNRALDPARSGPRRSWGKELAFVRIDQLPGQFSKRM